MPQEVEMHHRFSEADANKASNSSFFCSNMAAHQLNFKRSIFVVLFSRKRTRNYHEKQFEQTGRLFWFRLYVDLLRLFSC